MCEILFISSGFLVGYNYYRKNMKCDYESSLQYCYKHIRNFYPLEFINTLYGFFVIQGKKYNLTDIEILISNLLMIKSWSRYSKLASCFNSISWFLSALIFCYFLTPLLLKGIENICKSLKLFVLVLLLRILIEEIVSKGALNLFDANFHRGPIIRLLEFYMGMLLIPSFFLFKFYLDKYKNRLSLKIFFTLIQLFLPSIIYWIMLKYNYLLLRCYFIIIFCIFIFISGYEYGFLSDLFASKFFVILMNCQMEMYLVQITINDIFNKLINNERFVNKYNNETQLLVKLFIIFISAYSYKICLKDKFSKLLDSFLTKLKIIIFN